MRTLARVVLHAALAAAVWPGLLPIGPAPEVAAASYHGKRARKAARPRWRQ